MDLILISMCMFLNSTTISTRSSEQQGKAHEFIIIVGGGAVAFFRASVSRCLPRQRRFPSLRVIHVLNLSEIARMLVWVVRKVSASHWRERLALGSVRHSAVLHCTGAEQQLREKGRWPIAHVHLNVIIFQCQPPILCGQILLRNQSLNSR